MNKITEITKRDILDLFRNGLVISDIWESKRVSYPYYGRLEEIEFLKRLYDLKSMPSLYSMYANAEEEIWQHTVKNDDYPYCWVFEDERFQLKNGRDDIYLKFLCEIFHPTVRCEEGYWREYLNEINRLLQNDGYELYPAKKISNRDIYDWRIFNPLESKIFVPYSQRNQKMIKEQKINITISRKARYQIYQLLEKYNAVYSETDETGWNYKITTFEKVVNDIKQFYIPKYYNDKKRYVETNDIKCVVSSGSPYTVIDIIEFFEKYNNDSDFELEINAIFKLNELPIRLINGKIESIYDAPLLSCQLASIQEYGLKELLQEADSYYNEGNYKIAVEKIWDAFERLKTYYSPTLDKKKSLEKIINDMSENKEPYKNLFEKEFSELTVIGNSFRIRHHETTKADIEDNRHFEYFYKRCLSLISVAIQYLDNS